ncbi:MAG: PAS domain-containing protein [Salinarimonas sp.]|nr:PAS domain-containing protein [Salinarimonas sp.]
MNQYTPPPVLPRASAASDPSGSTDPARLDTRALERAASRGAAIGAAVASAALITTATLFYGFSWILLAVALSATALALVIAVTRARTTQKRLQVSADQRIAVAEALLANIPDPVILVDRAARVREANAAAQTLFPAMRRRAPIAYALRAPEVLGGIEQVLRTRAPARVTYTQRLPTERAFELLLGPLDIASGPEQDEEAVMLYFRDLTNAHRLERMRVDFIANVSHELRTPLASVLGFIETLEGPAREDADARARFLAIMREQAMRMTRLIDELLSLSRIELRAHVAPTEAIDLMPVIRQILDTLAPLAQEEGVTFHENLPKGPAMICGDRDELLRVVENLVENAVKYGGSGGRVDIGLTPPEPPGRAWTLSVRDYGPGIERDDLPRLTERFYRADVAQSRKKGGTGLGLAIVKHIVARHRGRLSIESEPGEGAVFSVTLPDAGSVSAERLAVH